ncbi:hypothetical protein LOZ58_001357 [Ophidiomyces ophidiicola]|nr:hypothetical protein LOZ66_000885 [Ophidiomyces ophidiicola]KAI1964671.1 hypothetical protein LOZ58_001357 [Ophidiomyces ophidiicola]
MPPSTFPTTLYMAQWRAYFRPRFFSFCATLRAKQMPPRPTIDEAEITGSYLKGSGPGGQKINKTSSAVQLKHLPTNIVVKSQATRSRSQNRKIAMQILAEKVEQLKKGDRSRAAIVAETKRKRKASKVKKSKRKYRLLDEEKSNQGKENIDEVTKEKQSEEVHEM